MILNEEMIEHYRRTGEYPSGFATWEFRTALAELAVKGLRPEGAKWIHVKEQLPEDGQTVLGSWGIEGPGMCGVATYERGEWHEPEDDEDTYRSPEFWMPLPASPERVPQQREGK